MVNPENRLFCRLDGLTVAAREQQRLQVMTALGILEPESVSVFEEATQTAAHFLAVPLCILGIMERDRQWFKAAVGLSRLGLMNELATSRQLPRIESFCTNVVDSQQILNIEDALNEPAFCHSHLVQQYGIRAYLGVPLLTAGGVCIGTLAVMNLIPRCFTDKEIEFLVLTARWSMSEFERKQATKTQPEAPVLKAPQPSEIAIANQLKVELLSHLTQELRTPLTSVMGMASVLIREIYGPLTHKQKEYLDIIHNSGQYLLSLVNEILELADLKGLKEADQAMKLNSVDIEMLCQQVVNTLNQAAGRREQQIRLSVEPGRRIWLLDKDKIRQMLYHLVFSVIQSSNAGSVVRLHVSHRSTTLTIAVWVSHPWLGESIPHPEVYAQPPLMSTSTSHGASKMQSRSTSDFEFRERSDTVPSCLIVAEAETPTFQHNLDDESIKQASQKNLGLLLSHQLAKMHGGQIVMQGAPESGYRYVILLPQITVSETGGSAA